MLGEPGASARPPHRREWVWVAVMAVVMVTALIAVDLESGIYPTQLSGPQPPHWERWAGGGNTCPNPSFLINSNFITPTPDLGSVSANYSYSGGCYVFTLHASHAGGTPFPGVFVGAWIRPATGPGSYGSPPPSGWSCGPPPPGANAGLCIYVPPPEFTANGTTDGNGTAALTIGMPVANYTVQLYAWIGGTTANGSGALNTNLAGLPTAATAVTTLRTAA